jgi:hypothetical protein
VTPKLVVERARPRLVRMMLEELDHVAPASMVVGMRQHGGAAPRTCERHGQRIAYRRLRAVGHQ